MRLEEAVGEMETARDSCGFDAVGVKSTGYKRCGSKSA